MPNHEKKNSRSVGLAGVCGIAMAALIFAAPSAKADLVQLVDIIPNADSSEADQNSEPSIAVNPTNTNQMFAGAFGVCCDVASPFYQTTNGGTTWSNFGTEVHEDKSMTWSSDGTTAIVAALTSAGGGNSEINTYRNSATNFGSPVNTFNPGQNLDQPWVRSGPGGHTYVTYNNLSNFDGGNGKTASIIVSTNNGTAYGAPITLETVTPLGGQDAPSVRSAVNGNTAYAVFTRWGGVIENDSNGVRFGGSQVVIAKSTDGGASFAPGVVGAATTGYFANTINSALTLGENRTSSDAAIAVDPNNANHVVVAYGDAPGANGSGQLQLHVIESTNGGATWVNKFTTAANVRSALPAISITANGTVGLLYAQYDPQTDKLSQHLVTSGNDFATTQDALLGTERNGVPGAVFHPYLGDFYDLTAVGNRFYGIFSASNADDGTDAIFSNASYQRDFTGTAGTGSFQLVDANGRPVGFSIDPYFFSFDTAAAAVPEPASMLLFGGALFGLAGLRAARRRRHS